MVIDDRDLLAYADGQLAPERRAEIEAAIASSADVARRVNAMRASALPYAAAFEAQILPPVPRELSDRIAALVSTDSRRRQRDRWAWPKLVTAFAAGVLCCAIALQLLSSGVTGFSATAQAEPGKLVTTIGVDNLLIVQDGDAILVADRREEGTVKQLVELLKKKGLEQYT